MSYYSDTRFSSLVRKRHSVRGFINESLSEAKILEILQDAQYSPSNCNTQPWVVHIVSGETKNAVSQAMLEDYRKGEKTLDFTFDHSDYEGIFGERRFIQGATYYKGLGIERDNRAGREEAYIKNLTFFDAPHVAFLFMPKIGDNVRVAGDVGMYAQTFLLALTARGYAGVPQTVLGFHADAVRRVLGVSNELNLLFGISFGFENIDDIANRIKMERAPLSESITLHY